ncbi:MULTISPECIES: ester cyclase [Salinibaculum]|uniref:ester cyclase n=1 Tax=Salinibaculum TaxID=2732368 RepID=UPI0030CC0E90
MSKSDNKELQQRFVDECWNEGNTDLIDELYSENYVGHWYLLGGGDADREALKAFIQDVRTGFPDFEMTVEFMIAEDDMVSMGFTADGTHEGEFMGIPPSETESGTAGATPGHLTHRFEDGKIVESWSTWDALGLLLGLGVIPEDLSAALPAADD